MLERGPYKDKEAVYQKAREIRKKEGLGYKRISKRLSELGYEKISWSTISNWVGDIEHSKEKQRENISKALRSESVAECGSKKSIRSYLEREREERKCENCNRSDWMGEQITLEIHRKTDKSYENCSEEEIEWLCPNCHSMTDGWRGRN